MHSYNVQRQIAIIIYLPIKKIFLWKYNCIYICALSIKCLSVLWNAKVFIKEPWYIKYPDRAYPDHILWAYHIIIY